MPTNLPNGFLGKLVLVVVSVPHNKVLYQLVLERDIRVQASRFQLSRTHVRFHIVSVRAWQVQGLNSLFGDYLTRCLYSKMWSLREAAVLKVTHVSPN